MSARQITRRGMRLKRMSSQTSRAPRKANPCDRKSEVYVCRIDCAFERFFILVAFLPQRCRLTPQKKRRKGAVSSCWDIEDLKQNSSRKAYLIHPSSDKYRRQAYFQMQRKGKKTKNGSFCPYFILVAEWTAAHRARLNSCDCTWLLSFDSCRMAPVVAM